jgi:antitoxin StbD
MQKKGTIMQIKNYLSSTNLAKHTAATLNSLGSGETDKLIILKNNSPKAILMSFEAYEAMEEEIEDLRLTGLALSRIQNFNPDETISHKEMMDKYTK